jgi:hypothetical protein
MGDPNTETTVVYIVIYSTETTVVYIVIYSTETVIILKAVLQGYKYDFICLFFMGLANCFLSELSALE